MVLFLVLHHMGIEKSRMAFAMAPLLDASDDKLRSAAEEVADIVEANDGGGYPNFSYYRGYLNAFKHSAQEDGGGLTKRMFSSDPGKALLTFLEVHEKDVNRQKQIRWAEKIVSDYFWKRQYGFLDRGVVDPTAVEQLTLLSQRPEWWVRLYVAYIYRVSPELRSEEVVHRLRNDAHPLVKQAMNDSGQQGQAK